MQQNQSGPAPEGLPEDQSTGHTLREIADRIGIDKSTVFRYVQRCGIAPIDATQRCKRYSATAENDIIQHFATMRNDSTTMRGRLAMMRNSSGNDAGNDAQGLQRCIATTPDSSEELDAIRAELDRVTAERDQLRQRLDDQSADHVAQLERIQTAAAEERRELNAGHRQELDAIRADHAAQLDRLRAELDDLRRELSTEREHSRATSEKLAQLTDQAQQLQAAQLQRASAPLLEAADDQTEDARPSLWARIFGKK
jgi:chromosome segregation ATPase